MIKSGIYRIRNLINNKSYIGSAVNFKRRWNYHKQDLIACRHHSKYLQNAWNKYGEAAFEFKVMEYVEDYLKKVKSVLV